MDFSEEEIFNSNNYPKILLGRIADEAACPCLSGELFKNCCKEKVDKIKKEIGDPKVKKDYEKEIEDFYKKNEKKQLSKIVQDDSISKKEVHFCLASEILGDCSKEENKRTIKAHSITKNGILNSIDENNKLMIFNNHLKYISENIDKPNMYFRNISIKDASVTRSFCSKHDNDLFSCIEKSNEFQNSTDQQIAFALRSLMFSIYFSVVQIKYLSSLAKKFPIVMLDKEYLEHYRNHIIGIIDDKILVNRLLDANKTGDKVELKTYRIQLPFKSNFACSDLLLIKHLPGILYSAEPKDMELDEENLFFINIFPNKNKTEILLSYFPDSSSINNDLGNFLDSIQKITEKQMDLDEVERKVLNHFVFYLTELISINVSNIYFSKSRVDLTTQDEKTLLFKAHVNSNEIRREMKFKEDSQYFSILPTYMKFLFNLPSEYNLFNKIMPS